MIQVLKALIEQVNELSDIVETNAPPSQIQRIDMLQRNLRGIKEELIKLEDEFNKEMGEINASQT